MPSHKKDGKWYWGSKGPFDSKEQADAVGRAAYANGYDSARTVDGNGYVTVEGNPISKEGVYDYLGSEIPGYTGNPNDIVKVYRPGVELAKQETIDSFKLMPFIDDHTWLGDEGTDPGELPLSGMTGEQVYWDPPYLRANIRWFSNDMKDAIDSGKRELSPGYKYDVYHQPGVFEGQPYSYVQTNLRGNHLANVETGRTGKDVAVMDAAPEKKMTLEEIIAAIGKMDDVQRAALCAAIKAQTPETDPAITDDEEPNPGATVDEDVETDPAKPNPGALATDAEAEDEEGKATEEGKGMDAVIKRLNALEKENKALKANAMDTGAIMKAIGERNALAQRVSVHTGAFACDSMTTLDVAKYGIDKLGLKGVVKGQEIATLSGYLSALDKAPEKTVAFGQDSAPKKSAAGDAIDAL